MIYVQLLIGAALLITQTKADLSLCASKNTGSTSANFNIYQSNGYCKDECSGYAFAILQGSNCWCSNTKPSDDDTSSTDDCSDKCPGYPSDYCGNEDKGLYGYIQLAQASSTDGGKSSTSTSSSSTSTSTSSTSTTSSSETTTQQSSSSYYQASSTTSSEETTSSTSSEETTSSSTESSTSPSTTSTSTSSTSTSSSSTSTSKSQSTTTSSTDQHSSSSVSPQTSIIYSVRTITGSQQTQATTQIVTTVTNAPSSNPSTNNENNNANNNNNNNNDTQNKDKDDDGFFDSKGKIAGTFTAVGVVVLAMLSTLLYCCCFKKRHNDDDAEAGAHGGIGAIGLDDESANSITNEKYYDQSQGQYGQTHGHVATNSDMTMNPNGDFVTVDQRLDPRQMFMNWENGSRKSLADELDYSRRVLRVTND